MPPTSTAAGVSANPFLDVMEALSNRQGQMDVRLEKLRLRLPFLAQEMELNGTVSVSIHLRDLSDRERSAFVAKQMRALSP